MFANMSFEFTHRSNSYLAHSCFIKLLMNSMSHIILICSTSNLWSLRSTLTTLLLILTRSYPLILIPTQWKFFRNINNGWWHIQYPLHCTGIQWTTTILSVTLSCLVEHMYFFYWVWGTYNELLCCRRSNLI